MGPTIELMGTGLLLSCSIIMANFVSAPWAVIGFMTLAFFGNGMASIGWSIISSVAPRRLIGLTGMDSDERLALMRSFAGPLAAGTSSAYLKDRDAVNRRCARLLAAFDRLADAPS